MPLSPSSYDDGRRFLEAESQGGAGVAVTLVMELVDAVRENDVAAVADILQSTADPVAVLNAVHPGERGSVEAASEREAQGARQQSLRVVC